MIDEAIIERVARALWDKIVYRGYTKEDREMEWFRNDGIFRSQARAAIEEYEKAKDEARNARFQETYREADDYVARLLAKHDEKAKGEK